MRLAPFVILLVPSLAYAQSDTSGALPPLPQAPAASTTATAAPPPPAASAAPAVAAPPPSVVVAEVVEVPRHYRHQGFYLSAGGGAGFMTVAGSGPPGSASLSGAGSMGALAIGGTVAPGLVIGGLVRTWSTVATFDGGPSLNTTATYYANGQKTTESFALHGNARASSVELAAFIDWYPNPEDGWHVGGSIGFGGVSVTDDAGTSDQGGGGAASISGGYQWWLGPSWSLGLAATASIGTATNLEDDNQNNNGYHLMPFGIGIGSQLLYY